MSLRHDESGVSEIVGALMLVLVVSSAAFGFGLFIHQQSRETQEQKAAAQEKRLERITIPALASAPVTLTDPCNGLAPGDGDPPTVPSDTSIDTLSLRLTSEHLRKSTIEQLLVNGMPVRQLELAPFNGSNVVDFPATTAALEIQPRASVIVQLKHVSCVGASSPFYNGAPIDAAAPLQVEVITSLGNHVQQAFIAPNAIIVLDTRGSATTSYILDASRSTAGNEGGFLVSWSWSITCGATDPDCNPAAWTTSGRIAQAGIIGNDAVNDPGTTYDIVLEVKDNFGRTGTTSFSFTLS